MKECWAAEPSDRPTFKGLAQRVDAIQDSRSVWRAGEHLTLVSAAFSILWPSFNVSCFSSGILGCCMFFYYQGFSNFLCSFLMTIHSMGVQHIITMVLNNSFFTLFSIQIVSICMLLFSLHYFMNSSLKTPGWTELSLEDQKHFCCFRSRSLSPGWRSRCVRMLVFMGDSLLDWNVLQCVFKGHVCVQYLYMQPVILVHLQLVCVTFRSSEFVVHQFDVLKSEILWQCV